MVRHPGTGKYRRTRLFLFTLGYSRKSVRLLTFASSTRRWCELHEESFRRLGGTVQVVVLNNLREGVLTPDVYDPALNPLYRDVLAHYGSSFLGRASQGLDQVETAPRDRDSRHRPEMAAVPLPRVLDPALRPADRESPARHRRDQGPRCTPGHREPSLGRPENPW